MKCGDTFRLCRFLLPSPNHTKSSETMAKKKHARSATRVSSNAEPAKPAKVAANGRAKSPNIREKSKATKPKPSSGKGIRPAVTLKDRVEQAVGRSEPRPTTAESDAVRLAISVPGLLDEVREEAFVELGGVVQRKLAKHGVRLTQSEAANVAWWIVGHPDDVPDA
jgi:hypothetical protein